MLSISMMDAVMLTLPTMLTVAGSTRQMLWCSTRLALYLLILRLTTRSALRRRRSGSSSWPISVMADRNAWVTFLVLVPIPERMLRRVACRLRVKLTRSGSTPWSSATSAIRARMA